MAAEIRSDTRQRARRALAAVNRYAGWVCLILTGLAVVLFFHVRGDLVKCTTDWVDYHSEAQVERTRASVENQEALYEVIKASQVLLQPDHVATPSERANAYNAFVTFVGSYADYRETAKEYPYRDLTEACKDVNR